MTDECLKSEWLYNCLRLAGRPSDIYDRGCRKIHRLQQLTFDCWDDSLCLKDVGFTDAKWALLKRQYLHEESQAKAIELWQQKRDKKFGHVAFHTCNHLTKTAGKDGEQGPCLLSVVVTKINGRVEATAHSRSIEICKKFCADLVFLRDELLRPFGTIASVTCQAANVTVHPIFFQTLFPHFDDPVSELKELQRRDPRFHRHVVCYAKDMLCGGTTNEKYAQARRVKEYVLQHIDPDTLEEVRAYLRGAS
jgi:hypothetical protein